MDSNECLLWCCKSEGLELEFVIIYILAIRMHRFVNLKTTIMDLIIYPAKGVS